MEERISGHKDTIKEKINQKKIINLKTEQNQKQTKWKPHKTPGIKDYEKTNPTNTDTKEEEET